jgi:succinate dehydrogenase flavin-adding protein (antitoxin of CptAB toxin-antitoxin module)
MKLKQNSQQEVCSYILEQLQKLAKRRLTDKQVEIFRVFWECQDYQLTAFQLNISANKARADLDRVFKKLQVRQVQPNFHSLEDFLAAPIFIHPFSTRLYHVLRFMDCGRLQDLLAYTEREIMKKRGFGKRALEELREYFQKSGWGFNRLLALNEVGTENYDFHCKLWAYIHVFDRLGIGNHVLLDKDLEIARKELFVFQHPRLNAHLRNYINQLKNESPPPEWIQEIYTRYWKTEKNEIKKYSSETVFTRITKDTLEEHLSAATCYTHFLSLIMGNFKCYKVFWIGSRSSTFYSLWKKAKGNRLINY